MWLNIARVLKVVSLGGFFLPWMVVSCADQPIASASGVDMMLGRIQAVGDAMSQQELDPVWWVIAMAVLIAAALILGILVQRRLAGVITVLAAGGALALGAWGMNNTVSELEARAALEGSDNPQAAAIQAQLRDAIRVETRSGYWITMLGLVGAGAAGLLVVARGAGRKTEPLDL